MGGVVGVVVVLTIWRFLVIFGGEVFQSVGLSRKAAGFEARSALVGAGYTTNQSEAIVQHPVTRKVAAMLIVTGYFGPTTLIALLGVSFVAPTDADLSDRLILLVVLLTALLALDRLGVIRAIGSVPARAVARRMLDGDPFESWIAVGDHAVGEIIVPLEDTRVAAVIAVLHSDDVRVLAVDRSRPGHIAIPDDRHPTDLAAGDRVVVFGPQRQLGSLRNVEH